MAANNISTLEFKADRQIAKLDLAKINRTASGRTSTLTITDLPTTYKAGDNTLLVDNPNVGGLVQGRPWS